MGAGGAHRADVFQLAVRAGVALRAVAFSASYADTGCTQSTGVYPSRGGQPLHFGQCLFSLPSGHGLHSKHWCLSFPWGATTALRAVSFQLTKRTRVALSAVAFHLSVGAPLPRHQARSVAQYRIPPQVTCTSSATLCAHVRTME